MRFVLIVLMIVFGSPVHAGVDDARRLMEDKKFAQALQALRPAADAGLAEAEHLIGVIYSAGLGVGKDPRRAFAYFQRAALKANPGAQSSLAWSYENGLGHGRDVMQAFIWYRLADIGGDPDAKGALQNITGSLTQSQIDTAEVLITDYRTWLYPLR